MTAPVPLLTTYAQGAHSRDASLGFTLSLHIYTPARPAKPQYTSASEQSRASLRISHQKVTVRLPEPQTLPQPFSALL